MKKALLAYNPMSGNRFVAQNLDAIVEAFQQMDIYLELYRISADEYLLEKVKTQEVDFIVGAGGDGTIGQVIASMLHYDSKLPFMALGTGTCNNFTRNIEDTKSITSPEQASMIIKEAYRGEIEQFDVGLINDNQIFLTSLAGGNFIDTSFATDKNLKYMLGSLAYYIKPITEISNIKSYNIKVTVDGQVHHEDVFVFVLLNGNSVGNFDNFIDHADMRDGVMELVLIKEGATLENLAVVSAMLKGEDISDLNSVKVLKGKEFLIECDENMPVAIDGEEGPPLPLHIKVVPQAISVMVANPKEKL